MPVADWEADYSHVGDHRWLTARGLFVAEGRMVVRRLLESGRFRIASILLTPAALTGFGGAIETEAPVHVAEPDVLNRVTGFNFHRGCLALAYRPDEGTFDVSGARRLLALEGVGNPDNVGGLFRVAAAFGVDALLIDPTSGDPFYRKAIRTSMGAVLSVPFVRLRDWPGGLVRYRDAGFELAALTPARDAGLLSDYAGRASAERIALMVGSEGQGLSDDVLAMADHRIRIPIADSVDSLNVTVAAGVALAWMTRQENEISAPGSAPPRNE